MGVAANGGTQIVREFKSIGIFANVCGTLICRNVIQIGNEIKVINPFHKRIDVRVVRQKSGDTFRLHRILLNIVAVNGDGAFRKVHHPGHSPKGSGFTCSVVADESIDLTWPNM